MAKKKAKKKTTTNSKSSPRNSKKKQAASKPKSKPKSKAQLEQEKRLKKAKAESKKRAERRKKMKPEQRLFDYADQHGIYVKDVLDNPSWIKEAGVSKKQLTDRVKIKAQRLEQEDTEQTKQRVWALGGKWNGKYSPEREFQIKEEKRQREQKQNAQASQTITVDGRRKRKRGASDKDFIYQAWKDDPSKSPDELIAETQASVLPTTVKNWTRAWSKGKHLPSSASQQPSPRTSQTTQDGPANQTRRQTRKARKQRGKSGRGKARQNR